MKKLLAAGSVLALTTGTAHAMDLGWGLALNNEVKSEYNIDTEHADITWTPEVAYTWNAIDLTAGMTVPVYNTTDEFALTEVLDEGNRPDLDLKVEYTLGGGLVAHGKTGWDLNESELADMVVGVTFSF